MDKRELKDLGPKPNWVSSQSSDSKHQMSPWPMRKSVEATKEHLKSKLKSMRGAKLVKEDTNSMHYEFTTALLRFVDDVKFVVDADERLVHFSSQSRVGYGDLGANRKRMEQIAAMYSSK